LGVVTGGLQKRISTFFNVALALLAVALCAAALARLHSRWTPVAGPLDRRVPEVKFDALTFSDALGYFRNATHLDFRIDWKEVEASGTYGTTPVTIHLRNMTLRDALEQFLARTNQDLTFEMEGNVVRITTQAMVPRVVKTYDVSDLLPPSARFGPPAAPPQMPYTLAGTLAPASEDAATRTEYLEEIAKVVSDSIVTESWVSDGGAGTIWVGADRLFVLQTREGHRKIETLLHELHKASAVRAWKDPPATQPD
jgi:hypothetical protein